MYTKQITYKKTFLSGLLEGLTVPVQFATTVDAAPKHMHSLAACTFEHPGYECITHNAFSVSELVCKEAV